ncbi:hypothetical protein FA15DRAFT_70396 [Coprinopsis marcescibilis]|uniref:Uncharacterized protein n=1 Tax=Coprinopsis marcescibilis TaxID=230819 RepID=A0A5C3KMK9_COPMA|nr:hypothetical protein FA15DRAFT_70396 [Coprinopsis marcescibilis]
MIQPATERSQTHRIYPRLPPNLPSPPIPTHPATQPHNLHPHPTLTQAKGGAKRPKDPRKDKPTRSNSTEQNITDSAHTRTATRHYQERPCSLLRAISLWDPQSRPHPISRP